MEKLAYLFGLSAAALMLAGCNHIKGVVVEDPSGRPSRTAILSVGMPTGIAVYDKHQVDAQGRFDFMIGPTDDSNIYLYDGAAAPEMTMRHVDSKELGTDMKLHLRPAPPPNPYLPVDTNINP